MNVPTLIGPTTWSAIFQKYFGQQIRLRDSVTELPYLRHHLVNDYNEFNHFIIDWLLLKNWHRPWTLFSQQQLFTFVRIINHSVSELTNDKLKSALLTLVGDKLHHYPAHHHSYRLWIYPMLRINFSAHMCSEQNSYVLLWACYEM